MTFHCLPLKMACLLTQSFHLTHICGDFKKKTGNIIYCNSIINSEQKPSLPLNWLYVILNECGLKIQSGSGGQIKDRSGGMNSDQFAFLFSKFDPITINPKIINYKIRKSDFKFRFHM